jgi:hypothetical protein
MLRQNRRAGEVASDQTASRKYFSIVFKISLAIPLFLVPATFYMDNCRQNLSGSGHSFVFNKIFVATSWLVGYILLAPSIKQESVPKLELSL